MSNEKAIMDRLLVIPFHVDFGDTDKDKYDEVLDNKELFFNFIMTHGQVVDKIDLRARMKTVAHQYSKAQASHLRNFVNDTYWSRGWFEPNA